MYLTTGFSTLPIIIIFLVLAWTVKFVIVEAENGGREVVDGDSVHFVRDLL
jgi:hypothetical protein